MLFGRRKPGYTTTVDGSADPEQAVLDLQKAELAAKKKPKAEVFDIDAASETARRLKETGSTFDGSAAKAGEDVMAVVERETAELAAKQVGGLLGHETIGSELSSGNGDEAVAFYPNQIKSATDNVGTFSRTNDRIDYFEDASTGISYNGESKDFLQNTIIFAI